MGTITKEIEDKFDIKLYTKAEVEALLSKIVSDSNIPKYTIQESGSSLRMDQVFPFRKWCDENL